MKVIIRILSAAVLFLTAVIPVFQSHGARWLWLLLPCFFLLNVFPSHVNRRLPDRRLRLCADGCELLIQLKTARRSLPNVFWRLQVT